MFHACCFRQRTYIAPGLFNGVLNILLFAVLMIFSYLWVLYSGHLLFFLEYVYLSLLYLSFISDMFLSLYVCVLEWFWIPLIVNFSSPCVRVCVLKIFVCACVVVWFEIYR